MQAELQQKPSAQWPLPHWASVVHAVPLVSASTHAPATHFEPPLHCASTMQLDGHVAESPTQRYGAQAGLPALPAGAFEQVPPVPGSAHVSHAPAQAVSQHTPSTQWPLAQVLAVVQSVPGTFVRRQTVPSQ